MTQTRDIDWSKHRVWSSENIRTERRELDLEDWGSPIERETRRRIRLSIAAYAYEMLDRPIMEDDEFDKLAQSIQRRVGTCHPLLDEFFITQFSPMTGMWIHAHPELPKIKALYQTHYAPRR
jgi:hypothetical protein